MGSRWLREVAVRGISSAAAAVALLVLLTPGVRAQDENIILPVDSIERRLAHDSFEIVDRRASRGLAGERTSRTALTYDDGTVLVAKWARASAGGEAFNNNPRFERGAYELQKLFLDEPDYVVPPTIARVFPLSQYRELDPDDYDRAPTFRGTESALVVLQYWLFNVTDEDFWDSKRFDADTLYARHLGDFNILTYLVHHGDQNKGNYLISRVTDNPRVFSVDNGLSFSSRTSDRGYRWRQLRVDRLPAGTVQRLRSLTPEDLVRQLAILDEFRVRPDGTLERAEPTTNLDPASGIRRADDRIQLGLTSREIGAVWGRIQNLLTQVDRGRIEVF